MQAAAQSANMQNGSLEKRLERQSTRGGFSALFRKELADHLHSVRFWLIYGLMLLVTLASLSGAVSTISDTVTDSTEFIFLNLFTGSGNSIPSIASFMAYLAPLVGIVLGFDAISSEKAQGTLSRLISQPIHRDAVITAKFLASAAAIAMVIFSTGALASAAGLVLIGIPPAGEEVARILSFLVLTWVYTAMWLGVAMLCSAVCRHSATGALITIGLWIFLTLFASMVVSVVATMVYPTDGMQGYFNMYDNYALQLTLNRVSPYYLFCEAASTLLNPNVRTLGITTQASVSGALASYLSFGQSVLLVWPHLVCMVALAMAAFTGSYVSFMRREIRA